MTRAVASVAIKKMVYLLAHGLYLALGLLFGRAAIRAMGVEAGGHPRLVPALYAAATVAMLAVGVALPTAWRRGGPAQLLFRLGRWFPSARLRRWLDGQAAQARAIDGDARTFFTARAGAPVVLLLLLQWLTDVAETYLALRLLRVDVGLYSVLAFEAFNSIARSIAFFLPAGLGVQELNQLWFLRSLGVVQPAAIAAALVILKRSKDLVWTVTGYALLGRAWRAA